MTIEVQNIVKKFGAFAALNGVDLKVADGELVALLGPSGSGKTTCLMMLAGFEFPTGGEIRLEGQLLNKVPPHKRNIGMVFQNYALFPHMTVAQNVAYPLSVRGVDSNTRAERVKRALDMVQMGKFGDRYPAQLSGGQQQRIALARALVFDPKLVLMDEPLGALDKQLREHMQLELKAMHQRLGLTFIYVTHDQSEALTMSDRVAVFDQGVIQQLAVVDELYEFPQNQFVAGFIGDNNRFNGTVETVSGGQCAMRLPDGSLIKGLNINTAQVGQQVTACVRPERIALHPGDADTANALRATVSDLIYFGDHVRVRCAVPKQDDCFVKIALNDKALPGLEAGIRVSLDIEPERLRIFN